MVRRAFRGEGYIERYGASGDSEVIQELRQAVARVRDALAEWRVTAAAPRAARVTRGVHKGLGRVRQPRAGGIQSQLWTVI